jgi:hypothetical protein
MAGVNIDFGASSCIGGCQHCRFGTADSTSNETFSSESFVLLQRLIQHSYGSVRLAYMFPILDMEKVPGLDFDGVETLSVPVSSFAELKDRKGDIIKRLEDFRGEAVELSLNHFPVADVLDVEHFATTLSLQCALFTALPNLREVYLGLNHNTSDELLEDIKLKVLLAPYGYKEVVENRFGGEDFGDNQVLVTGQGEAIFSRAVVRYNERQFSFGCRYLLAHDAAKEARSESKISTNGRLTLAVVNRGVHIGHSTYTINNPLYWCSHREFEKLLDRVEATGLDLLQVCEVAIAEKQKLMIKSQ